MNFQVFKQAIAKQFERMQKHQLFRADVDKDVLWAAYLSSFPAGTNPLYRERTEHDCSCCRQFIHAIGNCVAIIDDKVESIWDVNIEKQEPGYQVVANALSALVKSKKITDKFLYYKPKVGTDRTFEQMISGGQKRWDHFAVTIDHRYVVKDEDIASALAGSRDSKNVLIRSLTELTVEAVDTVLELIAQNTLYRGAEQKFAVTEFKKLKSKFAKLKTDEQREIFVWQAVMTGTGESVARIRNTAIGTLLIDLSADMDLENAVQRWESVMAPMNYKRPSALVTKAMIKEAKATIEGLGLTSALSRRFATLNDITINNILFADRDAKQVINGDVFDALSADTSSKVNMKTLDKIDEVPIEQFLTNILPTAKSLEILVENRHTPNFVSLIAPEDPTAGELFKWANKFSWSYNGGTADSIKERVKAAGGSVIGDLCCRLAWEYRDDLDFHMKEPDGYEIYYGNRSKKSPCGGMLDLDANGVDGDKDDPAENIFYSDRHQMKEGVYTLTVHNFSRRSEGVGFEVEIEYDGTSHHIAYDKVLRNSQTVTVAKIKYSKADGFEIIESLPSSQNSKKVWNLATQTFHKVNVVMLSPNFWDGQDGPNVGNKNYFFMIDGCKNNEQSRGFFNEFLKPELNKHRRVLEMVGSKLKVAESDEQLSGLGFSSTNRNTLVCRVKGSFTRLIKIVF